jgi:UDPglucose 6-dehydrogenase
MGGEIAKIGIIGSGTVGVIVGRGLKQLGNKVVFHDIREKRVKELRAKGLSATTDLNQLVAETDISFLCVPTPTKGGKIDLSNIKSAAKNLAKALKKKSGYYLVVVKSTVAPTTTEKVIVPIIEKASGKKAGRDFGVCMNPEFLTEIHESWTGSCAYRRDFFSEDRIVIGELDKKSGDMLAALYKPLRIPIIRTDLKTAEIIKYACNCALASRISYWNEIFFICQKLGVDSNLVAQVAGMDERIGTYGTVHSKAFGGTCLPKDLDAFIAFSKGMGYEPKLLKAVADVNRKIKAKRGVRE